MKKLTALFMAISFMLSMATTVGFAHEGASFANEYEGEERYIFYIGDEDAVTLDLNEISIDVITEEDISSIESKCNTNIITTTDVLSSNFEHEFRTAFEQNNRILIMGDISEEEVREYFNLPMMPSLYSETQGAIEGGVKENRRPLDEYGKDVEVVDVAEFPMLGQMVYQNEEGTNITTIFVDDLENTELVADTVDYCFSYDYLGLSGRAITANDYSDSWSNVDIETNTYTHERATITTSIGVERNDGNPNYDGEYLFYIPYRVDVDINEPYAISYVSLDVHGNIGSDIYDYGPMDTSCDANASISFQLPYAVSVSFSPGTSVEVEKTDGGLDENSFTVEYRPQNFLGFDSMTHDRMQCEAHIEGYQTGRYFQAYGSFDVETYRAQQPSGGSDPYVDPIIITNSHYDYAGGY